MQKAVVSPGFTYLWRRAYLSYQRVTAETIYNIKIPFLVKREHLPITRPQGMKEAPTRSQLWGLEDILHAGPLTHSALPVRNQGSEKGGTNANPARQVACDQHTLPKKSSPNLQESPGCRRKNAGTAGLQLMAVSGGQGDTRPRHPGAQRRYWEMRLQCFRKTALGRCVPVGQWGLEVDST